MRHAKWPSPLREFEARTVFRLDVDHEQVEGEREPGLLGCVS